MGNRDFFLEKEMKKNLFVVKSRDGRGLSTSTREEKKNSKDRWQKKARDGSGLTAPQHPWRISAMNTAGKMPGWKNNHYCNKYLRARLGGVRGQAAVGDMVHDLAQQQRPRHQLVPDALLPGGRLQHARVGT